MSVSRGTRPQRRLRELADGYALNARQREQLATIVGTLEEDEHAPSSVRTAAEVLDVHLADSLVGLGISALRDSQAIVDIGSGAGFPGLPLAVALPQAEVRLLESQARKCAFLRRVCREAGIANAEVVCARAEEWYDGREANDAALARAVGPPAVVLEYAAPLLRIGGTFIDWRSKIEEPELTRALHAAAELGMEPADVHEPRLFAGPSTRSLYLYLKVMETPKRFPRRPGMARKRPLGRGTNRRASRDVP